MFNLTGTIYPFNKTIAVFLPEGPVTLLAMDFCPGLQYWVRVLKGFKSNQKVFGCTLNNCVTIVPMGTSSLACWYCSLQGP